MEIFKPMIEGIQYATNIEEVKKFYNKNIPCYTTEIESVPLRAHKQKYFIPRFCDAVCNFHFRSLHDLTGEFVLNIGGKDVIRSKNPHFDNLITPLNPIPLICLHYQSVNLETHLDSFTEGTIQVVYDKLYYKLTDRQYLDKFTSKILDVLTVPITDDKKLEINDGLLINK